MDETFRGDRQLGAVRGGQRLRVPARHGQPHVGALVDRAQHPADEGGVQERHVGGADEGHLGAVLESSQPGGYALHRALVFVRVVDDVDISG